MTEERLHNIINGEKVYLTEQEEADIRAQWASNASGYDKISYILKRQNEYGSIADQLDMLYHGGYDTWFQHIKSIKDKYPKPT